MYFSFLKCIQPLKDSFLREKAFNLDVKQNVEAQTDRSVHKVFDDARLVMKDQGGPISPTAVLTEFLSKRTGLYKLRNKHKPAAAKSLVEVKVNDTMTKASKEPF